MTSIPATFSRRLCAALIACLLAAAVPLVAPPAGAAPGGAPAYELAGRCLRLEGDGVPGGRYVAQAAALGRFLFHDTTRRVLTADGARTVLRDAPSTAAIWSVRRAGDRFRLTSAGTRPAAHTVTATPATGCTAPPEAQLNVTGGVAAPVDAAGRLLGFADSHAHLMAEQFLGGGLHCGKPYSPLGITVALRDCPDHAPGGWPALSEHILSEPGPHGTDGWPTFTGWPTWYSVTHEQTYYRWIERAWRGGLRTITNYYVQNRVLCSLYPLGGEPCDETASVRIQHRRLLELQDYIDAQAGGPGKGFFRIVTDAQQARAVIADGRLAVVLGVEVSEPFGCGMNGGAPACTRADIDRGLDDLVALGVRRVILTHKFDNALGGARTDPDLTGLAVETGQVIGGGLPWHTEPCRTAQRDNPAPLDAPGRCNTRGLTALGAHAVDAAIARGLVIDVDHLSVKGAERALDIAARRGYPGVTSSHSWTDPGLYRRILQAGGAVGLYAAGAEKNPDDPQSKSFLEEWRKVRAAAGGAPAGVAVGPDMNGLGKQAAPRRDAGRNPVRYPFRAPNGALLSRQVTGSRAFDVNVDGTAHYGLLPDWIESLRLAAGHDGDALVDDLNHGAAAQLAMWERTEAYSR